MNVLIVDDLIEVVRSVSSGVHWQQLGVAQVFIACSVDEAKRILGAHEIALLLCDIEMPPSSGFELLEGRLPENKDEILIVENQFGI